MISSILNPSLFEYDFRPLIGLILFLFLCNLTIIIKFSKYFKKDLDSDWE